MGVINDIFYLGQKAIIKLRNPARENETVESRRAFDKYKNAFFVGVGMSEEDKETIKENYREKNDYYRMLNGLPKMDDEGIKIETDISWIDDNKYIHEMDDYEINLLVLRDELTPIQEQNPDKGYLYHLTNRIPFIVSRSADTFTLLDIDTAGRNINNHLINVFKEMYGKNQEYFMKTIYNDYYHQQYDYYEEMMVCYLILSTIISTINEVSKQNIDINMLDNVEINKIFESYGLPDWSLPQNLKERLVNILNKLIYNKGSKQTIIDIADMFGLDSVYRYYLHKNLKTDTYDETTPAEEKYNLNYVRVPFGSKDIYQYLNNDENIIGYTDLSFDDDTWGATFSSEAQLEQDLLESDFSFIETKYMSVGSVTDLSNLSLKSGLFFQYFFNNRDISDTLELDIEAIGGSVTIFDAIVYLTSLAYSKMGYEDKIPQTADEVSYVMGLNDEADLEHLKQKVKLFLDDETDEAVFDDFSEIESNNNLFEVMDQYSSNTHVIEKIKEKIMETNSLKEYEILNHIYDTMSTINVNQNLYNGHTTYSGFLEEKNPSLYKKYVEVSSSDEQVIKEEMVNIIETLEYNLNYLNDDEIENSIDFFSNLKNEEINVFQQYLFQIVDFFKSHTNELADFSIIYKVDGPFNRLHILEELTITGYMSINEQIEAFLFGSHDELVKTISKLDIAKENLEIDDQIIEKGNYRKGGFITYE